ncbi:hypothetical protein HanXRQr2_Chr13g0572161 [Helianthus annuus]|uniref:Uncharacterized protein n=1 Tax=Helianthus annuus TaxID=4232 RepID=A0A9K3HAC8_HELAN|nr:hypothetical protein HanXRQr2_Chr13g0572161 [Helianthus annuus]
MTSRNHVKLALHKDIQVTFSNYGTVGIGEPCGVEYLVAFIFYKS